MIPSSTYRVQLSADFTLHDAARTVGYLAELGVGAIYVSPLLAAHHGSSHGYDVVDHRRVDPERGGEEGLAALREACSRHGLGLVVDIVPNHMGVADARENAAWSELLRLGPDAATAPWFDVDWNAGGGRILIPVLGDDFDAGRDLSIVDGELRYGERRYPLAPGSASHGDRPEEVHERQHYELVNFRRADTEQNYRRFFAVVELAGLRVEDDAVFDATHAEILRFVEEFGASGLRVDHPDGLSDPGRYLERLARAAPSAWLTVEKILEPGEELAPSWPVAGTTGYDALAEVNSVMLDPEGVAELDSCYRLLTGDDRDWKQHFEEGKRFVVSTILQAEVRRIGRLLAHVDAAPEALAELAVALDVYRTYLPLGAEQLQHAAALAAERRPDLAGSIEALLGPLSDPREEACVRFQQLTGAAMAKGIEDTAFYRYTRLVALNEVGSSPGATGAGPAEFHAAQLRRQARAPHAMTTLSTHDTKRGEDLRARLAVLTELAEEWGTLAAQLLELAPVPNRSFGYLLWQTFVATGFIERERMHRYAEKAMREAAEDTGWRDPDADFERAVRAAVDAAYDRPEVHELVRDFAERVEAPGWSNSLSQKLIQLTMPGVPDLYPGERALRRLARGPGQPPARRLRGAGRGVVVPHERDEIAEPRAGEAVAEYSRAASPARPPGAVHLLPTPLRHRPRCAPCGGF